MRMISLGALLAALLLLASPAPSQAACVSATPAGHEFFDLPLDAEGTDPHKAPEVSSVQLRLQTDCTLVVSPVVTNRPTGLGPHDRVYAFFDTDGNPSTGSPAAMDFSPGWGAGSERAIERSWDAGDAPMLGAPDGSWFSFPGPAVAKVDPAGFGVAIDALGVAPGATVGVWLFTSTRWLGWGYWDDAHPTGAVFTLPVNYSTTVPPAVTPIAPIAIGDDRPAPRRRCRIPNVRGRRPAAAKRALRRARCKVGATRRARSRRIRKGRVVRTQPAIGKRTSSAVRIVVSRGR